MARRSSVTLWLACSLAAIGCKSKEPPLASTPIAAQEPAAVAAKSPVPAQPARPAGSDRFGAPLGPSPVVPLADILRDTAKYARSTVRTEGRVTSVCQAAGCWMEIADATGQAHVRMNGHGFFVPKTASGRRAIVEGSVLPKPDNGECEQEAAEATGRTVKVELDATGVELL